MKINFSREITKCYHLQNREQSLKYSELIRNFPDYKIEEWKEKLKTYNELLDTLTFLLKLINKLEVKDGTI